MFDKQKFFAKSKPKTETVTIPGFEKPFIVAGLTAAQRGEMFKEVFDGKGVVKKDKFFAGELVARCVVDEKGNRIFDDSDIPEIGTLSPVILDPLFEKAQELSGLKKDATDKAIKN